MNYEHKPTTRTCRPVRNAVSFIREEQLPAFEPLPEAARRYREPVVPPMPTKHCPALQNMTWSSCIIRAHRMLSLRRTGMVNGHCSRTNKHTLKTTGPEGQDVRLMSLQQRIETPIGAFEVMVATNVSSRRSQA